VPQVLASALSETPTSLPAATAHGCARQTRPPHNIQARAITKSTRRSDVRVKSRRLAARQQSGQRQPVLSFVPFAGCRWKGRPGQYVAQCEPPCCSTVERIALRMIGSFEENIAMVSADLHTNWCCLQSILCTRTVHTNCDCVQRGVAIGTLLRRASPGTVLSFSFIDQ
jgi:hypothetical protein